jgi:tetratricopeptide (TPR) repeat protein
MWLDHSDAAFRHTINCAPQLANVSMNRLALRYEMRRYEEVLVQLPSLLASYERFGMLKEATRCRFMEVLSLKGSGRSSEAFELLTQLKGDENLRADPVLHGQVLVHLGDIYVAEGQLHLALKNHQEALEVLGAEGHPIVVAELKWSVGEIYRSQGTFGLALEALREAQADFRSLGMRPRVVYLHLAIAETLLAVERHREAEWEALAALSTIEEQKMVPEGFAAVALLKESVRRRKTDPNALRELREHLQANK